ncbi:adenylyl-sulfate kinase [bacterium]|nr:adenylyl-sulfate kinase [candidate division CSSED10-310 bacterium]
MTEHKATNVTWHEHMVSREEHRILKGHKGATIWFTGLSSSGKSTLANALAYVLHQRGIHTFVLDGDNVRHGLNKNLGFSPEDRTENIRRVGEVAKLFTQAGIINTVAFISPYIADRQAAREIQEPGDFFEVYVEVDLDTAEERDPKGLYKKARAGLIPEFTGISAPYEAPPSPELVLNTARLSVEECLDLLLAKLTKHGVIPEK